VRRSNLFPADLDDVLALTYTWLAWQLLSDEEDGGSQDEGGALDLLDGLSSDTSSSAGM
jgi:hypothetical protein